MDTKINHPQEKIIETMNYNGVIVDVVEWEDTIWCGKASDPTDEKLLEVFQAVTAKEQVNEKIEDNWDVAISINHLSKELPPSVMFGFLVGTENQSKEYDIYKVSAQQFMRIRMNDETAKALGKEPFRGGCPPHEWIGEQIAPKYGYKYADATKPIFEYYGFYNPQNYKHEFYYLYVPVEKRED
jgi:hypothetical protein